MTPYGCLNFGTFPLKVAPTIRYLPAVAFVSYLFDRSHSWYAAFLKIFVLVQGTFTPLVMRHDRRTNPLLRSGEASVIEVQNHSSPPAER